MRPIRALFVTYGVTSTETARTPMIGVLKRCARLIEHLRPGAVEAHLLHFGSVLTDDPLLRSVLPRVRRHELGFGHPRVLLNRLLRSVAPDVVVLGEGPCGGMMTAAYESARELGVRLLCIENLYGREQPARYLRDTPAVDQWLLLGLPLGHRFGRIGPKTVLAPPLLPKARRTLRDAPLLTILGYDMHVAHFGLELLRRLPGRTTARLLLPRETWQVLDWRSLRIDGRVSVVPLPSDVRLAEYLSSSMLVACKSGFQQIVETLAQGTPIIAHDAPGGIPESWLSADLRPFVRYFPEASQDWSRTLSAAAVWLASRPPMPWHRDLEPIADCPRFAAELLVVALRETA